jgi:hypothetical protein
MRQSSAVMVAHGSKKDLGFMFQPPKRFGMNDPISIVLKGWPERTFLFKK